MLGIVHEGGWVALAIAVAGGEPVDGRGGDGEVGIEHAQRFEHVGPEVVVEPFPGEDLDQPGADVGGEAVVPLVPGWNLSGNPASSVHTPSRVNP